METFVINIGRQLGSGGRAVGHLLAERLDIAYYDKEILTLAARDSGLCKEVFERSDEHKEFFGSSFCGIGDFFGVGVGYYCNELSNDNLFRLQSEAIRKAAAERSCVFIGRCADYVLRDHPRCVNVFIAAEADDRIRRICENDGVDPQEAQRRMEAGDRKRAEFYNFYSPKKWGAAATYDLCLNSSVLGIEDTAGFIMDFVSKKLGLKSLGL